MTVLSEESKTLAAKLAALICERFQGGDAENVQMRRAAWLLLDQEEQLRIADVWHGVLVEQREEALVKMQTERPDA